MLDALLKDKNVVDVITTVDTYFVLVRDLKKKPVILTDKHIEFVQADRVLESKYVVQLLGGESLRSGDLAKKHGLQSVYVYEYSLKHLKPSKKQRFSHLLYGTKTVSSLLEKLGGKRIGKGAFWIPQESKQQITSFLDEWKCTYTCRASLLGGEQ